MLLPLQLNLQSASAAYSLTAATGSFAVTGQAAGLARGYLLTASAGAFSEAGAAADLTLGRRLASSTGAFAITGNAASLAGGGVPAPVPVVSTSGGGGRYSTSDWATSPLRPLINYNLKAAAGDFRLTGYAARLILRRNETIEIEGAQLIIYGDGTLSLILPEGYEAEFTLLEAGDK